MTNFGWWAEQVPEWQFLCVDCFEGKPVFECWIDSQGQAWDVCWACQKIVMQYGPAPEEIIPPERP